MTNKDKKNLEKKFKIFATVFKFVMLLVILIGIPLYIFICHREIITNITDLDYVESILGKYRVEGVFIYLAAQIIQIIICVIPGQELQIAAAFMYNFFIAFVLSVIGAAIGTVITFYLGKFLGKDMVEMIFGSENTQKYRERLNSKKGITIVFLIYVIPGLPKDMMSYIAGLSSMKLAPFLAVSLVGRMPGMILSLLVGVAFRYRIYHMAIIVAIVAIVLFIIAVIFRKKLINWFDKAYDKLNGNTKEM